MADQPDILQPASTVDEKTGKPFPTPGQPEGNDFPGEYIPSSRPDCPEEGGSGWGRPAGGYPFIWYGNLSEADFAASSDFNPCRPWYHSTAQINGLQINSPGISGAGNIAITGTITAAAISAPGHNLATKKDFDIPHPTKEGHRLRHVCLEGPEAGVYIRGRLTDNNVIELPEYWRGLVDPETITVTLTQIRTTQDLIVDGIEWGTRVKIKSGNASKIDCFYVIHAERSDGEKLIAEYKGNSIEDYPGDNTQYTHNR